MKRRIIVILSIVSAGLILTPLILIATGPNCLQPDTNPNWWGWLWVAGCVTAGVAFVVDHDSPFGVIGGFVLSGTLLFFSYMSLFYIASEFLHCTAF